MLLKIVPEDRFDQIDSILKEGLVNAFLIVYATSFLSLWDIRFISFF